MTGPCVKSVYPVDPEVPAECLQPLHHDLSELLTGLDQKVMQFAFAYENRLQSGETTAPRADHTPNSRPLCTQAFLYRSSG
jgi:hypothetical protein